MAIDRTGPPIQPSIQPSIQPDKSGVAQPRDVAGEVEITGKILSADTLRELDQIRNDPKLDEKIKTALSGLHKQLSAGFKGNALTETFTMGANGDTVKVIVEENTEARKRQMPVRLGLIIKVSRFDDLDGYSRSLVLSGDEHTVLHNILLPQTLVDTKSKINKAYEHLYTGWHD